LVCSYTAKGRKARWEYDAYSCSNIHCLWRAAEKGTTQDHFAEGYILRNDCTL